jgi:hypothetical protein
MLGLSTSFIIATVQRVYNAHSQRINVQ